MSWASADSLRLKSIRDTRGSLKRCFAYTACRGPLAAPRERATLPMSPEPPPPAMRDGDRRVARRRASAASGPTPTRGRTAGGGNGSPRPPGHPAVSRIERRGLSALAVQADGKRCIKADSTAPAFPFRGCTSIRRSTDGVAPSSTRPGRTRLCPRPAKPCLQQAGLPPTSTKFQPGSPHTERGTRAPTRAAR